VPHEAMHDELHDRPDEPDWTPDAGLRERIEEKRIVVLAVIDDGIPFAHRDFRDKSGKGTRVEFCWLQSVAREEGQRSVLFGREYTRTQIEGHIAQYGDDEDALYRVAGATADTEELGSGIQRHTTHGAHVMSLATGYAPEHGEEPAEEIRIIAVQLPSTIALDTSGFGKDMYMLSAFHYIFHRADVIAKHYKVDNLRLVINFSYGFSGGRHDGASELEAAIDQLVRLRRTINKAPTALVVPAGNLFLDRLHGTLTEQHFIDNVARIHWRLQPNDRTPSYLEIWFRESFDPTGYSVEVYDPRGFCVGGLEVANPAKPDGDPRFTELRNTAGQQVGQISADQHRKGVMDGAHDRGRWRVLVIMAPSEPEDDRRPGIDAGKWTIVLKRTPDAKKLPAGIHCWIQRDADPASLRSGSRQSYFDDPHDTRYGDDGSLNEQDTPGAFVQRFGSLNGLATAFTSLMVAGFRLGSGLGSPLDDARPVAYSSASTLDFGWPMQKVACSSMSDRSKALPFTVSAGTRSGSRSLLQGTSAAAPFVARRLAEAFVIANDEHVQRTERKNYRLLLVSDARRSGRQLALRRTKVDKEKRGRFGRFRVAPHRQPGVEAPPQN
jgi:hypothetical protein